MSKIWISSETEMLKEVIIGYPDNFHLVAPEIVNETQRKNYSGRNKPDRKKLIEEFDEFEDSLKAHGVEVQRPMPIPGIPDQLTTRDIGFVIDDIFVIAGMANQSRKQEWYGISSYLETLNPTHILRVPEPLVIEGGDVIVDKRRIYVGISQRTTLEGAKFLVEHFPNYEFVPVFLKLLPEGEDVLHLDCSFVPVGTEHALIYPQGFKSIPDCIRNTYKFLEVTRDEQQMLATNVLSISPTKVISRPQATRVNKLLRSVGITVIEVLFDEAPKTGGLFRCCSLSLCRETI